MSIDLNTDDQRQWVMDVSWVIMSYRPGQTAIRREARSFNATHFAVLPGKPCQIGFFDFRKYGHKRRTANPLAPVVAKALGPSVYAEFTLDDGTIWVLATDKDSNVYPGTDRIMSVDNRETMRNRHDETRFPDRRSVDNSELDRLIASLKEAPVKLYSVSLRDRWKLALAGITVIALTYEATHLYKLRNERLQLEAQRKALLAAQAQAEKERRLHAPIPPGEWIDACVGTALHHPVFQDGWTQVSWSCTGSILTLSWARSGGTVRKAPRGEVGANGESVTETVPLVFSGAVRTAKTNANGLQLLIGYLQSLDLKPFVGAPIAPVAPPGLVGAPPSSDSEVVTKTPVTWVYPTDPRSVFWDTVSGLQILTLSHINGVSSQGGAEDDAALYSFSAVIAASDYARRPP